MDDKPAPSAKEDAALVKKLLTGRAELDENEARYRQLAQKYGGNRKARRRARAEARKKKR